MFWIELYSSTLQLQIICEHSKFVNSLKTCLDFLLWRTIFSWATRYSTKTPKPLKTLVLAEHSIAPLNHFSCIPHYREHTILSPSTALQMRKHVSPCSRRTFALALAVLTTQQGLYKQCPRKFPPSLNKTFPQKKFRQVKRLTQEHFSRLCTCASFSLFLRLIWKPADAHRMSGKRQPLASIHYKLSRATLRKRRTVLDFDGFHQLYIQ